MFLVSAKTEAHTQESRTIRFWFRDWLSDGERKAQVAQDFFRELVSPKEFPRGLKLIKTELNKSYNLSNPRRLRWIHQEDYETHAKGLQ